MGVEEFGLAVRQAVADHPEAGLTLTGVAVRTDAGGQVASYSANFGRIYGRQIPASRSERVKIETLLRGIKPRGCSRIRGVGFLACLGPGGESLERVQVEYLGTWDGPLG